VANPGTKAPQLGGTHKQLTERGRGRAIIVGIGERRGGGGGVQPHGCKRSLRTTGGGDHVSPEGAEVGKGKKCSKTTNDKRSRGENGRTSWVSRDGSRLGRGREGRGERLHRTAMRGRVETKICRLSQESTEHSYLTWEKFEDGRQQKPGVRSRDIKKRGEMVNASERGDLGVRHQGRAGKVGPAPLCPDGGTEGIKSEKFKKSYESYLKSNVEER